MIASHEVPLWLQKASQQFNDYDYALVHLLESCPEYNRYFFEAKQQNRFIILDNSLYELGESFNEALYMKWINLLKPSVFIAPDKFGDSQFTIKKAKEWKLISDECGVPMMSAVHGSSLEEMLECYKEISSFASMIGISFASPAYNNILPDTIPLSVRRMYGRIEFINLLKSSGALNRSIPHHLLGLALPQELLHYKDCTWICSVDSSNPVALGLEGKTYASYGLLDKPSTIINNVFLDEIPSIEIIDKIRKNVSIFKSKFL